MGSSAPRYKGLTRADWWSGVFLLEKHRFLETGGGSPSVELHQELVDKMTSGLVLADALEESGYPILAHNLRKLTMGLRDAAVPYGLLQHVGQYSRWHSMNKALRAAIDEIEHEGQREAVHWYIENHTAYPVRRLGKNYGSKDYPVAQFEMLVTSRSHEKHAELYVEQVFTKRPPGTRLARGAARFERR